MTKDRRARFRAKIIDLIQASPEGSMSPGELLARFNINDMPDADVCIEEMLREGSLESTAGRLYTV